MTVKPAWGRAGPASRARLPLRTCPGSSAGGASASSSIALNAGLAANGVERAVRERASTPACNRRCTASRTTSRPRSATPRRVSMTPNRNSASGSTCAAIASSIIGMASAAGRLMNADNRVEAAQERRRHQLDADAVQHFASVREDRRAQSPGRCHRGIPPAATSAARPSGRRRAGARWCIPRRWRRWDRAAPLRRGPRSTLRASRHSGTHGPGRQTIARRGDWWRRAAAVSRSHRRRGHPPTRNASGSDARAGDRARAPTPARTRLRQGDRSSSRSS